MVSSLGVLLVHVLGWMVMGPPLMDVTMPGSTVSKHQTRWLAPLILETTHRWGPNHTRTITWYNSDGTVRKEVRGDANLGFVMESGNGCFFIHGLNEDWVIEVKQGEWIPNGFITGTADSRIFVHQYCPAPEQTVVDVYVMGRLDHTVGPLDGRLGSLRLASDGSFALLGRRTRSPIDTRIVAVGEDGSVCLDVETAGRVMSPSIAPGADGVLVQSNSPEYPRTFTFYRESGPGVSLKVGYNADLIGWLPGTHLAVMTTAIGYEHDYHLINWDTGEIIWELQDPFPPDRELCGRSTLIDAEYILLTGSDCWKLRSKTIHIIDTMTGTLVSTWESTDLARYSGSFFRQGDKVYFVTAEEVSVMDMSDIATNLHGWR